MRCWCGVEVSSDAVKYCVLRGRRLVGFGREPLGEIGSPVGVLRRLRDEGRVPTNRLRVALGTQTSILRVLALPPMPPRDLARVVEGEASKEQQLFAEEMAFGHQSLARGGGRESGIRRRLRPHGVPNATVAGAAGAVRQPTLVALTGRAGLTAFEGEAATAGFRLDLLTTTSLALLGHVRGIRRLERADEADAVLHLETDRMVLAVVQGGTFRQLRDLNVGLDASLLDQHAATGTDDDEVDWDALDQIGRGLDEVTQVARQIRRTLEADASAAESKPIRRLLLTGDVTRGEAMTPLLQNEIGLPVEVLQPLEDLRLDGVDELFQREAASYALPLSLAQGPEWRLHLGTPPPSGRPIALWAAAAGLAAASLLIGRMAAPNEERAQVRARQEERTTSLAIEGTADQEASLTAWIVQAGRGPRVPLEWLGRVLPPEVRTSSVDITRQGQDWSIRYDGLLLDHSSRARLSAWTSLSDSLRLHAGVSAPSLAPPAGEEPTNRGGTPFCVDFRYRVKP